MGDRCYDRRAGGGAVAARDAIMEAVNGNDGEAAPRAPRDAGRYLSGRGHRHSGWSIRLASAAAGPPRPGRRRRYQLT